MTGAFRISVIGPPHLTSDADTFSVFADGTCFWPVRTLTPWQVTSDTTRDGIRTVRFECEATDENGIFA